MEKSKKTVCVAGHFNPVHIGHLKMIQEAKKLGDKLIVIVANDIQAKHKRNSIFMSEMDRVEIMRSLKDVDEVYLSVDTDTNVCKTLSQINPDIFASGCTANHPDAIEEKKICDDLGIEAVYDIGGNKIRSSSEYLADYYLFPKKEVDGLDFFTANYLPLQVGMHEPKEDKVSKFHRHTQIAELLYVEKGEIIVTLTDDNWNEKEKKTLTQGESILLLGGGHQVEIKKGTRLLEVKQGPYVDDKIWKI